MAIANRQCTSAEFGKKSFACSSKFFPCMGNVLYMLPCLGIPYGKKCKEYNDGCARAAIQVPIVNQNLMKVSLLLRKTIGFSKAQLNIICSFSNPGPFQVVLCGKPKILNWSAEVLQYRFQNVPKKNIGLLIY